MARTSQFFFVMYIPFSVFCVLFVCKCVLYYSHRVSTQLQLKYIFIVFGVKHYIEIRRLGWEGHIIRLED
jgi:hypothetical protein